ncbi:MAG TPA: SRPBCC family protein [Solirubrobacterales bacterium]|nr:SRPBCC family protein [Solirubrobacterales bacterium]
MSRDVRAEAELPASPEEVWEVIMDPNRLGDWVTTHAGLEGEVPDRLEQGSAFKQRLKVGGAPFTVTWEVVESDRPRHVLWRGEGPGGSAAVVEYQLAEQGDSTRFTYVNRFELPGGALGRLAGRAVGERVARRESERTLENLARLFAG